MREGFAPPPEHSTLARCDALDQRKARTKTTAFVFRYWNVSVSRALFPPGMAAKPDHLLRFSFISPSVKPRFRLHTCDTNQAKQTAAWMDKLADVFGTTAETNSSTVAKVSTPIESNYEFGEYLFYPHQIFLYLGYFFFQTSSRPPPPTTFPSHLLSLNYTKLFSSNSNSPPLLCLDKEDARSGRTAAAVSFGNAGAAAATASSSQPIV